VIRLSRHQAALAKNRLAGNTPPGQVILEDIVDLLNRSTPLPLQLEQSLSIPTPHVRDHRKVTIGSAIPKEFSLSRSDSNGQVPIGFHLLLLRRFCQNKLHLRPLLSTQNQSLIGHFSQRLPTLFGKGLDGSSQLFDHIHTNGKLYSGPSNTS
jgi:hypothetical protein